MADLRERPEAEQITRFYSKMTELWSKAHEEFRDNDDYYQRKFNVWNQNYQGRPIFYDSTPTHLVDHAVATLMSFSPRVHREPVGDTEDDKINATNLEHGLKAVMDHAALYEPSLPWKLLSQYMVAHGYGVIEAPVLSGLSERPTSPDRANFATDEEYEQELAIFKANRKNYNPVRIRIPHPSTVLMNPTEKIPTIAIKASKMTAQDLHDQSVLKKRTQRRKFAEIFQMDDYDPWDEVEVWDYWTPYWHVKMLANPAPTYGSPNSVAATPIYMERNTWGFVPFVHAFSGLSGMDFADEGGDPYNFAQGILSPNKETIRKRTQEISAFHQMLLRSAFAPMGTSRDPMTLAQAIQNEGILEGDLQDFWVMNTPDIPGWMQSIRAGTDSTLEMGTYSPGLAGQKVAGVTTVGQQAILNTAGMRIFAGVAMQREHLASIVGSRILQLVDNVSELASGIGANGKLLTKAQINGVYGIQIQFPHSEPVMDMQQRQMAMSEFGAGLIDPMTYYEAAGYENGTEIKKRLIEESVRKLPAVREKIETLVAQELGLVDEENSAAAMEQIQQQAQGGMMGGAAPGAGAPPQEGPPQGGGAPTDLNEPLTPDTFTPNRINLAQ
jgi:hypothetical protein